MKILIHIKILNHPIHFGCGSFRSLVSPFRRIFIETSHDPA